MVDWKRILYILLIVGIVGLGVDIWFVTNSLKTRQITFVIWLGGLSILFLIIGALLSFKYGEDTRTRNGLLITFGFLAFEVLVMMNYAALMVNADQLNYYFLLSITSSAILMAVMIGNILKIEKKTEEGFNIYIYDKNSPISPKLLVPASILAFALMGVIVYFLGHTPVSYPSFGVLKPLGGSVTSGIVSDFENICFMILPFAIAFAALRHVKFPATLSFIISLIIGSTSFAIFHTVKYQNSIVVMAIVLAFASISILIYKLTKTILVIGAIHFGSNFFGSIYSRTTFSANASGGIFSIGRIWLAIILALITGTIIFFIFKRTRNMMKDRSYGMNKKAIAITSGVLVLAGIILVSIYYLNNIPRVNANPGTTEISGCSNLNVAGETYLLTTSFTNTTTTPMANCMDFTADNIVLDCQGYNMNGVSASLVSGIHVNSGVTNSTINNCNMTAWRYSVWNFGTGVNIGNSSMSGGWYSILNYGTKLTAKNNTMCGAVNVVTVGANDIYVNNSLVNVSSSGGGFAFGSTTVNGTFSDNIITLTPLGTYGSISLGGGFEFDIYSVTDTFKENITKTNTINGLPVLYYDGTTKSCPSNTVFTNLSFYGFVGFVDCNNLTISNSTLYNSMVFSNVSNSSVNNMTTYNSFTGIFDYGGKNNSFLNLNINYSINQGIKLSSSTNDSFTNISFKGVYNGGNATWQNLVLYNTNYTNVNNITLVYNGIYLGNSNWNNFTTVRFSGGILEGGIYLSTSSNNTFKDVFTTNVAYSQYNNHYAVRFVSSSNQNAFNNFTLNSNYYGIKIDTSNSNIIENGTVSSSTTADYDIASSSTTNFTNTDFTASRKIYFEDSSSWFNYRNDSSNNIWLKTKVSSSKTIARTLNNFTQTNVTWKENVTSGTVTATYNVSGLLPNVNYDVYNYTTLSPVYSLATDNNGNLPSFTISLNTTSRAIMITNTSTTSFAPTVDYVEAISAQDPIASQTKYVSINFTATDIDGVSNLKFSSQNMTIFGKTDSSVKYTNTSCSNYQNVSNTAYFTCSFPMKFYDIAQDYNISISINDTSNAVATNTSQQFTYNELLSMSLSPSSVSFGTMYAGDSPTGATDDPLIITNNGNKAITATQIKALGLKGVADNSYYIGAGNFTANINDASGGDVMVNNTFETVTGATVPAGASSTRDVYLYLESVVQGLIAQIYNSTALGSWTIQVS